jgi:peroxiredoxin
MLAPLAGATLPRRSPEYAIKLTTGRQILLSSFRGKVVVLMFVSTDCPHCRDTCELMSRLQKEYGPKGVQTLAVAFNEGALMLVPNFIQRSGATFPIGSDARDPVLEYLQIPMSFKLYVPIMVFIDRTGTIRHQYLGDDQFHTNQEKNVRATLDALLKEPARTQTSTGKTSSLGK